MACWQGRNKFWVEFFVDQSVVREFNGREEEELA